MEYIPRHSRREPRPIINGYMIGEAGEREGKKRKFFKGKKNQTLLYKPTLICGFLTFPIESSNTLVRGRDTAARCPEGCSSNFTPPPQSKKQQLIVTPQTSITGSKLPSAPKSPKVLLLVQAKIVRQSVIIGRCRARPLQMSGRVRPLRSALRK